MKTAKIFDNKPLIAESGNGMIQSGYATIICAEDGSKLKAITQHGPRLATEHAYFFARPGLIIVRHVWDKGGDEVLVTQISRVTRTFSFEEELVVKVDLSAALAAAKAKSHCLRCSHAHYAA